MPADHVHHLAQHARHRHERTLQRASETLTALAEGGGPVSIAALAARAGVSRSWIYTQPEIRQRIEQLQQFPSRTSSGSNRGYRASEESLRRRLELAHQRITQLGKENQQLREALAHAHGQLRSTKSEMGSP
jgi:predicted DNA-binding transcriptional regulator YafY